MVDANYPRLAIVTGSDSGIGAATAELLATEGYDVGLTCHRDVSGVQETKAAIEKRGQRAFVETFDAASPDAGHTIARLADKLGGLSVMVNVAGTGQSMKAVDMTYDDWRHVIQTDLDGPFLCAQAAARRMIADGHAGRIINVTSVHEHVPRTGSSAYCAAKAALGMFTKVLALELGEHAITVNSVAPGEIATPMTGIEESAAYQTERPGNPLGRVGHVNEVASVIGFLASPRSAYVTGASLTVDGGLTLMAAHGHDQQSAAWREV